MLSITSERIYHTTCGGLLEKLCYICMKFEIKEEEDIAQAEVNLSSFRVMIRVMQSFASSGYKSRI